MVGTRRNTLLMIGNNELVMIQHMRNGDLLWVLGETFRVALQWSGRNSMTPVSGCPWWCPIGITRIEQLGGEQRYPPQVQASAESDQVIRIRMRRVESECIEGRVITCLVVIWLWDDEKIFDYGQSSRGQQGNGDSAA
ncbi:hypothetical protein DEO72_LG10g1492 [Vigna unguiculata]|uniref:Uncharacterized protein n=1 Tax=Vigna unguiculata TaxID=3917 RepID=A0A4D6NC00_VIGUN|nr:hypothetical protein DEO72_LG10g1492 [Vigna unguiculata]